jgi:hypothetical protein
MGERHIADAERADAEAAADRNRVDLDVPGEPFSSSLLAIRAAVKGVA